MINELRLSLGRTRPLLSQETNLIDNYIKHCHEKIEGWLHTDATTIITHIAQAQNKFGIKGHVCEIGVHHGLLFILLYLLTKSNENAVAVDIFDKQYLNLDDSGKGDLEKFLNNLEYFAKDKRRLKVIAEDSTRISADDIKSTVGGEVRLFSIDGGHTADITRNDLRIASQLICEGGVIILDDCFNGLFPAVSEGTNQFFLYENHRNIVPFAIGTATANKLFLTSRNYADKYIEYLLEHDIENVGYSRQPEFFGHRVISFEFKLPSLRSLIWKKIKQKFQLRY